MVLSGESYLMEFKFYCKKSQKFSNFDKTCKGLTCYSKRYEENWSWKALSWKVCWIFFHLSRKVPSEVGTCLLILENFGEVEQFRWRWKLLDFQLWSTFLTAMRFFQLQCTFYNFSWPFQPWLQNSNFILFNFNLAFPLWFIAFEAFQLLDFPTAVSNYRQASLGDVIQNFWFWISIRKFQTFSE